MEEEDKIVWMDKKGRQGGAWVHMTRHHERPREHSIALSIVRAACDRPNLRPAHRPQTFP